MKKVALLTIGLLMVCNCAFAGISLPTGFDTTPENLRGTFENLGIGTQPIFHYNMSGAGDFFDTYKFTLSNLSDVNLSLISLQFTNFQEIDGFSAYIFDAEKNILGSGASTSVVFDVESLNALTAYYIGITGTLTNKAPAFYSGGLTVAPVPVPAAALLLGAGLLGIVGIRRRQSV